MSELAGYDRFDFTHGEIEHPIYHRGPRTAPSVLLIQELPGITPETLTLAQRLETAGYTIYLPHLFGRLGADAEPARNVADICIRREFYLLDRRRSAPFTDWLRALCREIRARSSHKVGAIGMCLTGSFVIPLIVDEAVSAPVASQPSHFGQVWRQGWRAELGIAAADEAAVRAELQQRPAEVLALRFRGDPTVPARRFDQMEALFGAGCQRMDLPKPERKPWQRPAHSVLTIDYEHGAGIDTRAAFDAVLEFFAAKLTAA